MANKIEGLKFRDGSNYGERKAAGNVAHKHRCMRCYEEFDCPNVGCCVSNYEVTPVIVDTKSANLQTYEHCPGQPDWDWIRGYRGRVRAELLEECCREECCLCAAGIPVEADDRWGYVHPAGSKLPSGKEAVIDAPCGAARLRRLGESR